MRCLLLILFLIEDKHEPKHDNTLLYFRRE
jgi:hypothetical protein